MRLSGRSVIYIRYRSGICIIIAAIHSVLTFPEFTLKSDHIRAGLRTNNMQQIYPYFIKFHIIFSIIFIITIIGISIYSLMGWLRKKEYGALENKLRKTYLMLLYTDLLLGIILYFFLQKPEEIISTEQAMTHSSLRFWAIQHFSNIIFVVILCVTGNLLIKKTTQSEKKFKYSAFYFGISTIIIIISVGLFALRN